MKEDKSVEGENVVDNKKRIDELTQQFLQLKILEAFSTPPELPELNFFRQTVETENGGVYLLSFQHVSGPKIENPMKARSDEEGKLAENEKCT